MRVESPGIALDIDHRIQMLGEHAGDAGFAFQSMPAGVGHRSQRGRTSGCQKAMSTGAKKSPALLAGPSSSATAVLSIVIAQILGLKIRIILMLLSGLPAAALLLSGLLTAALLLSRLLTWVLVLLARFILVLVGHRDDLRFVVRVKPTDKLRMRSPKLRFHGVNRL